jgi:hypothetical protein
VCLARRERCGEGVLPLPSDGDEHVQRPPRRRRRKGIITALFSPRYWALPMWSKYLNALCSRQLQALLGQVQPSQPAITVNVKQKLKQPIGHRFSIRPVSQNTLVIGQREDGETCRRVVLLNGGLERFRAVIIAVCGEQDDLRTLTCLPHVTI